MGSGNNYGSLLGLAPSDTSGTSKQNGTTVSSGTQTVSGSGTNTGASSSATSNTYDANAKNALDTTLGNKDFNKDAAISDAQGAMKYAVDSALKSGMPSISSAAKSSGGYSSTTQDMLNNDLTTRAAAAGSQVVLNNIASYSAANTANINAATGAVGVTKGVTTTGASTSGNTSTQTQTSDNTSTTTGATSNQSGSKGAVGDVINGGGPSGTVICTELYNDGFLSQRVYNADNRYVRMHFCSATVNGYRFWAVPFVALMRRSKLIYAIGKYFGVRWSEHCAAHFIHDVPKNRTGAIVMWIMVPICYVIGSIIPDVTYMKLYKNS